MRCLVTTGLDKRPGLLRSSGMAHRETTVAGMTRAEALEVLRAEAALARRQSESPYNHTCKELHVRKVFGEMAARLEGALAVLEQEGGRARRTSRAA